MLLGSPPSSGSETTRSRSTEARQLLPYSRLDQVAVSEAPVLARGWKYPPARPSFSIPNRPLGLHSNGFCWPNGSTGLS